MIRSFAAALLAVLPVFASESAKPADRPAPGQLDPSELREFGQLEDGRAKLVESSLKQSREHPLSRYIFGSADPARGGFDCSGAVYFLLRKVGIQPPRSSAAQFDWLKKRGRLIEVPKEAGSLDHAVFAALKPGDLLFWGGTYQPTDGRTNGVTHVQMYLGREKKDGRHVMIGSSDGRSYRGKARCGFGVYDFRLPRPTSKARFLGYGTPPGIGDEDED